MKSIQVSDDVWKKLQELKLEHGFKTINDLVEDLL